MLLKQVPADLSAPLNKDYTVNRQKMQKITNPADLSALNMALECRSRVGGDVLCVTMGPESATDCLRDAAMAGADGLYHICDPGIAGADTFVTAKILAAAIRKFEPVDLVFCGRHTVDGETGQVGVELAAMLGYGCLSQVTGIQEIGETNLRCSCQAGSSMEIYRLRQPAVLCVCECSIPTKLPSLSAMRRANKMPIVRLSLAELELSEISGRSSSPTKVIAVHRKEQSRRKTVWLEENAVETVAMILQKNMVNQDV